MGAWKTCIAHIEKNQDGIKRQLLKNHLRETAVYAAELGKPIGIYFSCLLIGLLHDLGKASPRWQRYIEGIESSEGDHATVGGYYVQTRLFPIIEKKLNKTERSIYKQFNEFLIYPILAHHGMYDVLKEMEGHTVNYTEIRLAKVSEHIVKESEWTDIFEDFEIWVSTVFHMPILAIYQKGCKEFTEWMVRLQNLANEMPTQRKQAMSFYRGATVRLLLSILKEADVYDSSNWNLNPKQHRYDDEETQQIFGEMHQKIEALYTTFRQQRNASMLNQMRTRLADELYHQVQATPYGCFALGFPVGAGKTNAVLRYALKHSVIFKNKRIFYTTAFLSVLEQNAQDIKTIIGQNYVLEHHSNVIADDTIEHPETEYDVKELVKDNWEIPVILTTLVQLSNTLFKAKSSCLRRFSKLIHSVIIIDEIQSLPIKTVYMYNCMTNFLTQMMGVTVVHCTATLPELNNMTKLVYPCLYGIQPTGQWSQLVSPNLFQHSVFYRVEYYSLMGKNFDETMDTEQIIGHIQSQLQNVRSILIIVNTRNGVRKLYDALCQERGEIGIDYELFYLTTNLCAAHRLDRIHCIKEQLRKLRNKESKRPVICVSTKLIEAGVNIDFEVVYRSLTSIDSVVQAAGRCNREGKLRTKGKVFIFKYRDEKLERIPEFLLEREAASEALRYNFHIYEEQKPVPIEKCLATYFERLYGKSSTLEYPIIYRGQRDSLFSLLSSNYTQVAAYRNNHDRISFILRQSFKTASQEFELIDSDGITVIVPYNNEELIQSLYECLDKSDIPCLKRILQKLQRYTISVRNIQDYKPYIDTNSDFEKWRIYVLSPSVYHEDVGIAIEEMTDFIF